MVASSYHVKLLPVRPCYNIPSFLSLCLCAAKLDGIRKRRKSESGPQAMDEYLQLPDDYDNRKSEPGKKRVSCRRMGCV